MWFQVELPEATTITEVQFNAQGGGFGGGGRGRGAAPGQPAPPPPIGPYPIAYRLEVSTDGSSWKQVAEGAGTPGSTVIAFAPVQARFVRLTQTGTAENAGAWSMQRLRLYRPGMGGGAR
jgi:hypothetical protein